MIWSIKTWCKTIDLSMDDPGSIDLRGQIGPFGTHSGPILRVHTGPRRHVPPQRASGMGMAQYRCITALPQVTTDPKGYTPSTASEGCQSDSRLRPQMVEIGVFDLGSIDRSMGSRIIHRDSIDSGSGWIMDIMGLDGLRLIEQVWNGPLRAPCHEWHVVHGGP